MPKLRKEEIERKLLHFIFGTIMPLGIFFLPKYARQLGWHYAPWMLPSTILAVCLAGFAVTEATRLKIPAIQKIFARHFNRMLRHEEKHTPTGATYINASGLICSILFKDYPYISCMVLSTFIWGDAVAALVGQSMGKIKIGRKTLEGSLACFALSMIMFVCIFPLIPGLLDMLNGKMPIAMALAGSACITIFELVPLRLTKRIIINDNLAVPVITGMLLLIIYPS